MYIYILFNNKEHAAKPDRLIERRTEKLAVVLGEIDRRDALAVGTFKTTQALPGQNLPDLKRNECRNKRLKCETCTISKRIAKTKTMQFIRYDPLYGKII